MALLKKLYQIKNYLKPLKKPIQLLLLLLPLLLLNGCAYVKIFDKNKAEVVISNKFNGEGIAVLTFTKLGPLPSEAGKMTADKLTDALYLQNHFNVVDRTKVNEAQAYLQITDAEMLSHDLLQQLGLKLKANYLILGRVKLVRNNNINIRNRKSELGISFRIISVSDTEIAGIAEYSIESTGNIENGIDAMIKKILKKIRLEND